MLDSLAQEKPKIVFDKLSFEFGAMKQDSLYVAFFSFENKGTVPLKIYHVSSRIYDLNSKSFIPATVGWIVPSWSPEPVPPGKMGFVKAAIQPKGRPGKFTETIMVGSNADSSKVILNLSGEIK